MRSAAALVLLIAATLAVVFGGRGAKASESSAYKIIVNPANPAGSLDRKFVEDAFLKKVTTWPDGSVIHPVDLPASSSVRRRFSEDVLERSVDAVRVYWQQRIFAGRDLPPPELENDAEVVKYVLKYDGAIGYVSEGSGSSPSKVVAVTR
jgi:ABC-type phosphate transport system substrate-binding protein